MLTRPSLWLTPTALERLALLKQDASQIGINARQTVEFLDRVTEGRDGLPVSAISLQGPTEQYQHWSDVEKHLVKDENTVQETNKVARDDYRSEHLPADEVATSSQPGAGTTNLLSQVLLNKLNFAKETDLTPPASPTSSNDHSAKTSPEIPAAKPIQDSVIVPPSLKPLVNALVWFVHGNEKAQLNLSELYFISNSADAASVMHGFGINTKNVHQLRQAIGLEDQELKNQSKYLQKHPSPPATAISVKGGEPRAMFRYDEDSDEEQLVFKPRGRGSGTMTSRSASGSPVIRGASLARPSSSHRNSTCVTNSQPNRSKPEIPTEEIDPDSFDRGSFGRANGQRLAVNDDSPARRSHRASVPRGGLPPSGPSRAGHRGSGRSFDRGSLRGRGRLFVP